MASSNNGDLFSKIQASLERDNMFAKELGINLTSLDSGVSETEMEIAPHVLNVYQTVHGGALYTLADTTAGVAAISATGCACVTLNSSISFLSPVGNHAGKLTAKANVLRWGRRTAVCEVYIYDQDRNLAVRGTFTICPAQKFREDETDAGCETDPLSLTHE
jgi:acyl-CoA thioesterase